MTSGRGRVSVPEYWLYFALYLCISLGSLVSIIYFGAQFRISIVLFAAFLMVVSGLGFRVIQMWRCRDIGWPSSLPWLLFFGQFGFGIVAGIIGLPWLAMMLITAALGVADFGFALLIGFMPTKSWEQTAYVPVDYSGFKRDDGSSPVSELNAVAMARLAERETPRPAVAVVGTAQAATLTPPRPGFGRKGL